ncbi:MAG TPA: hypothetical protein VJ821_15560 [Anaerolineales bacterium]|nr:hypothetical protein [Anaerolineales bacterium]
MTPSRVRTLVFILIFIGGVIVGFFGLRTLRAFREFGDPPLPAAAATEAVQIETDVNLIRQWMTIPFISKTYDVPQNVLFDALGIPPNRNREKSLRRLNREYFPREDGIVLEKIKAAVLAALADQPRQIQERPPSPLVPETPSVAP